MTQENLDEISKHSPYHGDLKDVEIYRHDATKHPSTHGSGVIRHHLNKAEEHFKKAESDWKAAKESGKMHNATNHPSYIAGVRHLKQAHKHISVYVKEDNMSQLEEKNWITGKPHPEKTNGGRYHTRKSHYENEEGHKAFISHTTNPGKKQDNAVFHTFAPPSAYGEHDHPRKHDPLVYTTHETESQAHKHLTSKGFKKTDKITEERKMISESIKEIVVGVMGGDAFDIKNALDTALREKIAETLEAKKLDIAKNLVGQSSTNEETIDEMDRQRKNTYNRLDKLGAAENKRTNSSRFVSDFHKDKKMTKRQINKRDTEAEEKDRLRENTIVEQDEYNHLQDYHRKHVPGLYHYDHFEHHNGSFIQKRHGSNPEFIHRDGGEGGKMHRFSSVEALKKHVADYHNNYSADKHIG